MSKVGSQIEDDGAKCPYCGEIAYVEAEDYSENSREEECEECGMKYYLSQIFTVEHETRPDCELNGAEHRWIEALTPHFEKCDECGKYRPAPGKSAAKENDNG